MFSQYGQIIAIMLSEEFSNINYDLVYNFVFIEFLTNSHAMNCKKMANKTLISKNSIRIKLTKYEKIYEVEDFEEDVGEIITYKDKDYLQRPIFSSDKTPERALTSHQPSEYQIAENIYEDKIKELCGFISVEGAIVRTLFKKNKNALVIEMENIDVAIKVVMYLNNIELVKKQYTKIFFCEKKDFENSHSLLSGVEEESVVAVKAKEGNVIFINKIRKP